MVWKCNENVVFCVAILTVVAEQCYDCCILCCAEVMHYSIYT